MPLTVKQFVVRQLRKTTRELNALDCSQSPELVLAAAKLRLTAVSQYMRLKGLGLPPEPEPEPAPPLTDGQRFLKELDELDKKRAEAQLQHGGTDAA